MASNNFLLIFTWIVVTRVPRQSVVPEGSGGSAKPRRVYLPDDACIVEIVDPGFICRVRHVDRSEAALRNMFVRTFEFGARGLPRS